VLHNPFADHVQPQQIYNSTTNSVRMNASAEG
jgi:hypothetical protein